MGQSPDQIRQEIDQKRADAAEKIDRIQSQVQDTSDQLRSQVTDTTEQVQETVQQVRQQVQGTVEDSVETAKQAVEDSVESAKQAIENFDIHKHVQERPLVTVAAAFVGGMVLGKVMSGGGKGHGGHHQSYQSQAAFTPGQPSGGMGDGVRNAVRQSGIDDLISNAAAALFGQVADQARTSLDRNFPGFTDKLQSVQQQEGSVMDKAKAAAQPDQGGQ